MSITAASLVKCEVHLAHPHVYPGDAVEGAVVIDVAAAFDVFNVHIKIVGKEEVYALVDQVKQSKTPHVQYGISSQDYVYYREILTLAGALMTRKEANNGGRRALEGKEEVEEEGDNGDDEPPAAEDGAPAIDDEETPHYVRYNESLCVRPGVAQQRRASVLSQVATEEGVSVRFPAGHYVYPFRFLLPSSLPPSYDTGICVKDGQYSNSQAALHYYVKVYVWSPTRVQLASARADFVVGSMQPDFGSISAPPAHTRGIDTSQIVCTTSERPSNSSSVAGDGSRAKLPSSSAAGKTVHCIFPVMGTCSCIATDAKLKVAFSIAAESFQIGRDVIAVTCTVATNTSRKALHGMTMQLIQVLSFDTAEARVTMQKTILNAEVATAIQPGKKGTIIGHASLLPPRDELIPSMKTSGLEVRYTVRVALRAPHVDQAYYEFDNIRLTGAVGVEAGAVPPVGHMQFTALPRGRLTKREAYYAIPMNPTETPVMAPLQATLSLHGSRAVSRRASRLNSLAVTPQ